MKASNLELYIEELILHGFAPSDRYRIANAMEHELARLFVEQGVQSSLGEGREVGYLDVGRVEVASGAEPQTIGAQLAQTVYRGLSQ